VRLLGIVVSSDVFAYLFHKEKEKKNTKKKKKKILTQYLPKEHHDKMSRYAWQKDQLLQSARKIEATNKRRKQSEKTNRRWILHITNRYTMKIYR